jgi:hypothetical protein
MDWSHENHGPLALLLGFSFADPALSADTGAPYPVSDEAFYSRFMELNGRDADGLSKCSCAINAVERQLSYERLHQRLLWAYLNARADGVLAPHRPQKLSTTQ